MNIIQSLWPFRGTLRDAFVHNWLVVRRVFMPGIPCGITVDAQHAPVGFDLTLVKKLGKTETKSIGVMGAQGFGKTFWATIMIKNFLVGDVGSGKARAYYPSLKHNNGRPETAPLVEDLLGCTVISPFRVQLNPLARALGMTFTEQFAMVVTMLQFIRKEKLSLTERDILHDYLRKMFDDQSVEPSFLVLHDMLVCYEVQPPPGLEKANQFRFNDEYYRSALNLQLTIKLLLDGIYGKLFSGDGTEIVKLLEARIVSWDFKGVSAETRSLIEIVLGAIQTSAIMPDPDLPEGHERYNQPKHPERIPHIMVNDEAYSAWANAEFADAEYERLKTMRSHGITMITLFHRPADLQEAIGNSNSRQLEKAQNALREIDVWLVGRQHKTAIESIRALLNPPEYVLQSLTSLKKGHFWVLTPWNEAPFLMMVIGTELEINTFNTDAANDNLMRNYFKTRDRRAYSDYLDRTTPSDEEVEQSELALQHAASNQGDTVDVTA